jgi:hypothetical protein
MKSDEWKEAIEAARLRRQHDRFAQAALTGLLSSPHFQPGGKRIMDTDWEGKSIEELGEMAVADLVPNEEDIEQYYDSIVMMADHFAGLMMKAREDE